MNKKTADILGSTVCHTICPECAGEGRVQKDRCSVLCGTCHGTGILGGEKKKETRP